MATALHFGNTINFSPWKAQEGACVDYGLRISGYLDYNKEAAINILKC